MTSHDRIIDINIRRKKHVPSHVFYNWSDLTASNTITAKFGLLSKTMASAPASTNALTRSLRFSAKTLTAAATSRFLFLSWQHELPLVLCLSPCNGWQHWMWNWSFEATGKSWFLIRSFRTSKPTISPGNAELSCHQNRWIFCQLSAYAIDDWELALLGVAQDLVRFPQHVFCVSEEL